MPSLRALGFSYLGHGVSLHGCPSKGAPWTNIGVESVKSPSWLWPQEQVQFSSVQSLSRVQLFVTLWTAACQTSLSITNSWSLLKLMCIESVMPSNHLILYHPLLFLPWIFPSIKVFSIGSVLHIMWLKYWSFSFSISPSNEYLGLISFRIDWFDHLAVQENLKSLLQHHSSKASIRHPSAFFIFNSHIHTWLLGKPELWLDGPLSTK